jgi:hypothetical protein
MPGADRRGGARVVAGANRIPTQGPRHLRRVAPSHGRVNRTDVTFDTLTIVDIVDNLSTLRCRTIVYRHRTRQCQQCHGINPGEFVRLPHWPASPPNFKVMANDEDKAILRHNSRHASPRRAGPRRHARRSRKRACQSVNASGPPGCARLRSAGNEKYLSSISLHSLPGPGRRKIPRVGKRVKAVNIKLRKFPDLRVRAFISVFSVHERPLSIRRRPSGRLRDAQSANCRRMPRQGADSCDLD